MKLTLDEQMTVLFALSARSQSCHELAEFGGSARDYWKGEADKAYALSVKIHASGELLPNPAEMPGAPEVTASH